MKRLLTLALGILFLAGCGGSGSGSGGGGYGKLSEQDKGRAVGVAQSIGILADLVELDPSSGSNQVTRPPALLFQSLSVASAPGPNPDEIARFLKDLMSQGHCTMEMEGSDPLSDGSGQVTLPQYRVWATGTRCPLRFEARIRGMQKGGSFSASLSWNYEALTREFADASGISQFSFAGTFSVNNRTTSTGSLALDVDANLAGQGISTTEGSFSYDSAVATSMTMAPQGGTIPTRTYDTAPMPTMSASMTERHHFSFGSLKVFLEATRELLDGNFVEHYKINGEEVSAAEYQSIVENLRFPGLVDEGEEPAY